MISLMTEWALVPAVLTASLPLVGSATHLIVRETEAQRAAPPGSESLALTYLACSDSEG